MNDAKPWTLITDSVTTGLLLHGSVRSIDWINDSVLQSMVAKCVTSVIHRLSLFPVQSDFVVCPLNLLCLLLGYLHHLLW